MHALTVALPDARTQVRWAGRFVLVAALAVALGGLPLWVSGAALLGACLVVLTFASVEFGLALLLFAVPFGGARTLSAGVFNVSATEFVVPLLLAAWAVRFLASRRDKLRLTALFVPLALFLAVMLLSTSFAVSQGLAVKELLKWLELAAVMLVVINHVRTTRQLEFIYWAAVLAAALQALYGLYQYVAQAGPGGFFLSGQLRPYGTFNQPNPFGGYLAFVGALALGPLIAWRRRGEPWLGPRLLPLCAALAVIYGAVLLSFSRGAWLAAIASMLAMLLARSRRSLLYLASVALLAALLWGVGALSFMPQSVVGRASGVSSYLRVFDVRKVKVTPENWAIVERMANWQAAWTMFNDRPVVGVGIGNFGAAYPDYAPGRWVNLTGHAHNYYLNVLAETGLPGLMAYLALLTAVLIYTGRVLFLARSHPGVREGPISQYGLALGVFGAMVALSAQNLVDSLYVHSMTALVGLVLGLAVVLMQNVSGERRRTGEGQEAGAGAA